MGPKIHCGDEVVSDAASGSAEWSQQPAGSVAAPASVKTVVTAGSNRGAGPSTTGLQRPEAHSWTAAGEAGVGGEDMPPAAAAAAGVDRPGTYSVGVSCGRGGSHVLRPGALTQDPGPPPGGYSRSCSRAAPRTTTQQQQGQQEQAQASSCPSSSSYSSCREGRGTAVGRKHGCESEETQQAMGPLLSDYFRPASAVAPGSCSLCGLPGVDPPRGFQVPSVKLPVNVSSSWDAGGSGKILTTVTTLEAGGWSEEGGSAGVEQGDTRSSDGGEEGMRHVVSECGDSGGLGGVESGSLEGPSVWQQSLAWSAVHEVDGRPATRSGGPRSR
jgi:hypothetical protein